MGRWVLLAGAIVAEISATLALRASDGLRDKRWLPAVVGCYLIAFTLLTLALSTGMGIRVAYGIWAASGVALTAVLARLIWPDPLTKTMTAGIALIAAGVLIVELGAH